MAEQMRTERYPSGIAGTGMRVVERQIPAEEPPALPVNAELHVVGKPVQRRDAHAKVTGAVRFTVDVKRPGMLQARVLRCPWPHARLRAIDTEAAARAPGLRALLPLAPAGSVLRYAGAPVAAVAAESGEQADAALRLIRTTWQRLPFVTEIDGARRPNAPLVYGDGSAASGGGGEIQVAQGLPLRGNVRGPETRGSRGDVARGFAEAELTIEAEYRTQVQTHCCMEPHAIVADWRGDGLTVWISTQYVVGIQHALAAEFDLPPERVRVLTAAMGGGFGSKSQAAPYAMAAVALSRLAGAPVRLVHSRAEEQVDTGNRPGTVQQLRIGARRDGRLTAISLVEHGTAGVGLGASAGNFAAGLYACPNVAVAQHDVFTNAGRGTAMRGPGNTPGAFAMEQAIDELAERLGLDPLLLRDRIDPSPVRREERRRGAERVGWAQRHGPGADPGPVKRGLGVAQSLWSANVWPTASCAVRLERDGTVVVAAAVQDLGTGGATVLGQVVAEEFGLAPEAVDVRIGDSALPPGSPSWGSLTTASMTPAARKAAWRVKHAMLRRAAEMLGVAPERLALRDGRILVEGEARSVTLRELAAGMAEGERAAVAVRGEDYGGFHRGGVQANGQEDLGGVQFAEVAVDTGTGLVRVERVVAVQDCGRPVNPKLIESQVQGGVLMGLSYALLEDRVLDRHTGLMLNANLEQYKFAGHRESPAIEVLLLENYQGRSATDAYGIAEPANIATAPAIANAVYNAIGVRLRALPMTPAAVLAALGRVPLGS